jgi:hypothetical protein
MSTKGSTQRALGIPADRSIKMAEVQMKPKKTPVRASPPKEYEALSPQGQWIKVIVENDGTIKAVLSSSRIKKYAAQPMILDEV